MTQVEFFDSDFNYVFRVDVSEGDEASEGGVSLSPIYQVGPRKGREPLRKLGWVLDFLLELQQTFVVLVDFFLKLNSKGNVDGCLLLQSFDHIHALHQSLEGVLETLVELEEEGIWHAEVLVSIYSLVFISI
jgi:hypothetical protein